MSAPPPRWHEVTAVYGGTFDPPHRGHREAVRGLFREPGVRRVLIVPSAAPPHKPTRASAEHRVAMARIAFGPVPGDELPGEVRIDTREIDRARATGRPSYSYETLLELRREHPQLAFVVGTDQLRDLPGWFRFPEVLDLCHWLVLERRPGGHDEAARVLQEWQASGRVRVEASGLESRLWRLGGGGSFLRLNPTEAPAASSTAIREELGRSGKPPEGALPPGIIEYLRAHRLYS